MAGSPLSHGFRRSSASWRCVTLAQFFERLARSIKSIHPLNVDHCIAICLARLAECVGARNANWEWQCTNAYRSTAFAFRARAWRTWLGIGASLAPGG